MFEFLQKKLLNKAMGKSSKPADRVNRKKAPVAQDHRTQSGRALDEAVKKLERSGHKMEDILAANEDLLRQAKEEAAKKMTPERRALMEQAQRIRKHKAKILDDLDDETRAKLYLTAIRAFTGKDV